MSKRKQSEGCRPMLRRTFLFLTGIALARVAADYLAIAQNRDSFLTVAGQLWQTSLAFLSSIQSNQTPQPLPSNLIVKSAKTNQPLPSNLIVKSPENYPAVQPSQPQIIRRSAKQAKPLQVSSQNVAIASFYLTTIDLADPKFISQLG